MDRNQKKVQTYTIVAAHESILTLQQHCVDWKLEIRLIPNGECLANYSDSKIVNLFYRLIFARDLDPGPLSIGTPQTHLIHPWFTIHKQRLSTVKDSKGGAKETRASSAVVYSHIVSIRITPRESFFGGLMYGETDRSCRDRIGSISQDRFHRTAFRKSISPHHSSLFPPFFWRLLAFQH